MIKEFIETILHLLREKMVESFSFIGGIITFITVKFPTQYEVDLFIWKFVFGFFSAIIYALLGWHIKNWLDKRKK